MLLLPPAPPLLLLLLLLDPVYVSNEKIEKKMYNVDGGGWQGRKKKREREREKKSELNDKIIKKEKKEPKQHKSLKVDSRNFQTE